ncbi:MAG TPA: META domain-containing protein [Thermoleophilia bacterium]|nr:META domain-containing protein [Thermoleophilia bacterium]
MGLRRDAVVGTCIAAVVIAVAVMAGCSSEPEQPALDGTSWKLTAWAESSPIPADVTITATFADGKVSGNSGVNTYGGTYESDTSGAFSAGPLASTMMAGPEEAMKAETAYLRRLDAAESYAITDSTLVLKDADGKDSLTFEAGD